MVHLNLSLIDSLLQLRCSDGVDFVNERYLRHLSLRGVGLGLLSSIGIHLPGLQPSFLGIAALIGEFHVAMKLLILDQGGCDRPSPRGRTLVIIIKHAVLPLKRELLAIDAIDGRFGQYVLSKHDLELRRPTLELPDVILLQVLPIASLSRVQPAINT